MRQGIILLLAALSSAFQYEFYVKPDHSNNAVTKAMPTLDGHTCRYNGRLATDANFKNSCPTRFIHHLYEAIPVHSSIGTTFRCGYDRTPYGPQFTTTDSWPICPDILLTDPGLIVVDTLMLDIDDDIMDYYNPNQKPIMPILHSIQDDLTAYDRQINFYANLPN